VLVTPQRPLAKLTPPDPPMLPFAVGGTLLWLVLGLVLLPLRSTLAQGGNENWIGICFTGALVGLVGCALMAVHDRNRRRRRAAARDDESLVD
jgi:membrane associated rhomboid family serine protease